MTNRRMPLPSGASSVKPAAACHLGCKRNRAPEKVGAKRLFSSMPPSELLEASDIVAATMTSDDVENTKPAPDIFATALKKLAPLEPEDVIVVGDTPYDIEAAAKCGIAAIGVRSGKFFDATLLAAGAVILYDDVAALLADFDASPIIASSKRR